MTTQVPPHLNKIFVLDSFRVVAQNLLTGLCYVFRAHSDLSPRIPMEFTCTVRTSETCQAPAYVETSTISTDGRGSPRNLGTGRILDEAVYNIEWRHGPGELDELKKLLSTRQFTNCGSLIGDSVHKTLTDEQALRTVERIVTRSTYAADTFVGPHPYDVDVEGSIGHMRDHLTAYFKPSASA